MRWNSTRTARCAAGLCFVLLSGIAFAAEGLTLNFDQDWKFIKADPPGASATQFDDSGWTGVSLPHTYNDVDTFDDWSIPGHVGEMNLWSGRTWYRKTFVLPKSFRGKKVFIEFQAVRQIAEVYLNGQLLGASKTGFIPFGFDLTPYLRFGGARNVLAVMADNRFTPETDMAKIILTDLPWNSPHWHPAHGGIYRNVYLHVTDPLHISLPLYSFLQTAGPYVYATEISDSSARVSLEVPIQNERNSNANAELVASVLDGDGKSVLELKQAGAIAAGSRAEFKVPGVLAKPQLWDPAHPYLYRVVCSLRVGGKEVDSREIPLGIRTVRWDTETGFYINGHHLKLHGWGQKPTDEWPGLGAAQPDWMHFFTLALMKEAGGNFVRWGHCAGAEAMLAASDHLGVITEQPGVDGEGDARGGAWTIRAAAFRDTIIYFRNHPSILIWEGGNQKVSHDHAKELRGYMDQYDPHGGRAYAHRRADAITAEFMDIGIGTEGGREIARLPVVEGEYDREESPRRVWDDFSPPNFGYPEAKGQTYDLTSEQYAVNQVSQYVTKVGAANHSGGANWIFSDSTSGGRVATEVARAGGEVDGVRLPKEAYYVCRTMFRDDPQVHIIGHWTYPAGTRKAVYTASNAEDVELFVNGRSLGHGKVSDRYLFTFPDVAWEAGEIKAVAYAGGKPVATQSKHTVGAPVALRMTPITGPGGMHADGSDIALIDVEAVDANGERCPTFQQRVDFEMEGPGVWRGGYNSGKIKSTNNTWLDLEAGINRVSVRATRTAGAITVRVKGAGLKPASVTIQSAPVKVENGFSTALPVLPAVDLSNPRFAEVSKLVAPERPLPPPAQAPTGKFTKAFSYSGPTSGVHVEQNAQNGKKLYVDSDARMAALPPSLRGADYVQTSNADKLYSAVDLMEITVNAGAVVSVAHDNRLPRPGWLTAQFKPTGLAIAIDGKPMQVFQHAAVREESLTLGANAESGGVQECNMYVVFVSVAASR
ncbi:MAG: sugar-binding domain-containing protein [Bryobacteraceae bacterium]|jgi:beta-galactosidase